MKYLIFFLFCLTDIEDLNYGLPELEIDEYVNVGLNIDLNTTITAAKTAVNLYRDSPYRIQHCDFEENYIDIFIGKYLKRVGQERSGSNSNPNPNDKSRNFYIRSCTFTSSGNTLLSPYSTVHKFAGIVLNDAERVVIGDSSLSVLVDENIFEKSRFGIFSNKSSFEVFNNSFRVEIPVKLTPCFRS